MGRTRSAKPQKEAPKGELKKPRPVWFVTLMAFVLPGSGQMFNGAPARGIIMQFGMVFGGYVSYQLTTPEISPIGRLAGGLLVWVFSIVDANGIANRRVRAWARIEAAQAGKASQNTGRPAPSRRAKNGTSSKAPKGAARKRRVDSAAPRGAVVAGADMGPASITPMPGGGTSAAVAASEAH
jgi:hypothetical protein